MVLQEVEGDLIMEEEQKIYDKFVEVLNEKLDAGASAQDLAVILNFLKYNNIQATTKHKGVANLTEKLSTQLPFEDEEELPTIRRVK